MSVYFTSDLHLGHDRDFVWEKRGFSNINEHDRVVMATINAAVHENDTLYILGDLLFGDVEDKDTANYYKQLVHFKCKDVRLIIGNHDSRKRLDFYKNELGINVVGFADLVCIGKQQYYLSHYPALTSNGPLKGFLLKEVVNLYGHTHQSEDFLSVNGEEIPLSFHVGLDSNSLAPVEIGKIRETVREKYESLVKDQEEEMPR